MADDDELGGYGTRCAATVLADKVRPMACRWLRSDAIYPKGRRDGESFEGGVQFKFRAANPRTCVVVQGTGHLWGAPQRIEKFGPVLKGNYVGTSLGIDNLSNGSYLGKSLNHAFKSQSLVMYDASQMLPLCTVCC